LSGIALSLFASEQAKAPELRKELVKLKYVRARDVREILYGYLSQYGRLTSNDELNIVSIQDIPEIVDKVLSVIKEIDIKPVDLLFTVDLILGSTGLEEVSELARVIKEKPSETDKKLESDPLIKELKSLLGYTQYKKLGSSVIRVQDNGRSEQRLGVPGLDLELRIAPRYVREEKEDTFQLQLQLTQYIGDKGQVAGPPPSLQEGVGAPRAVRLIDTPLTIKSGERTVVGVSKLDGGDKGLILIISGRTIK